MRSIVAASLAGSAVASYQCPGSPAGKHAGLRMTSTAAASCDVVKAEMRSRVAGENGWYDQHNRGTYAEQNYGGDISFSRQTGDGKYTDKMTFVLTADGSSCKIEGCSESQVNSFFDFSTNYCEQKLLICGSDEGCNVAHSDFTSTENEKKTMAGASTKFSNCLKVEEVHVEDKVDLTVTSYQCPGSPAGKHAGLRMTQTAAASCDVVTAEMRSRVAGENGWYDQHNRGTYTEQNYGGDISFSRQTGDGKYTDKMTFVLTADGSTCKIEGCSESQVNSFFDFSTNYCEQKLLICGSDEGCNVAHSDFTTTENTKKTMAGASTKFRDCLKVEETVV